MNIEITSTTPERVTQAQLARTLGVSRAAVHKAVKAGRIVADEDGRFDRESAIESFKANTRPTAAKSGGGGSKYAMARARREHSQANITEMEEAKMRGELCRVEDVRYAAAATGALLRSAIENMAERLAPMVTGKDTDAATAILEAEFKVLLSDISAQLDREAAKLATPPDGP